MKKILLIGIVLLLTGCQGNTDINMEYDNYQLNVTGQINGGCKNIDKEDSWGDIHQYNYLLDYKNNLEEYKNSIWIGYTDNDKQYISNDHGNTYSRVENTLYNVFDNNYREKVKELLAYINSSKKKKIKVKKGLKTFQVDFKDNLEDAFNIVTNLGVVGKYEKIDEMDTTVTLDKDNNITKIEFNITCKPADKNIAKNCYKLTWNFSNHNKIKIELPNNISN